MHTVTSRWCVASLFVLMAALISPSLPEYTVGGGRGRINPWGGWRRQQKAPFPLFHPFPQEPSMHVRTRYKRGG